jgi:hypothetical protein
MASVNETRPHCVNQMGKTHSKPFAARHGRGTALARHAMCESALRRTRIAYWVTAATNTHSECVIPFAIPRQQWLPERTLYVCFPSC